MFHFVRSGCLTIVLLRASYPHRLLYRQNFKRLQGALHGALHGARLSHDFAGCTCARCLRPCHVAGSQSDPCCTSLL